MNLLKSLEMFRAVAEHESFTRAADELSLAQPPISRGVADLEKHLGVRLFDRSRRRIRLTAAGRAVLPEVLEILRRIDGLAEAAGGVANAAASQRCEGSVRTGSKALRPANAPAASKLSRTGRIRSRFVPGQTHAWNARFHMRKLCT